VIKISQKKGFSLLKEKVPEFQSPLKMIGIFAISILIFTGIMVFFWWFDSLIWYGAIISQLIVGLISSIFIYSYIKKPTEYRKKYGELAYRYFFFHIVILVLITGNACIFHVLLIAGQELLYLWLAIVLGIICISMRFLLEAHIRRSGFDEIGHALGVFMVFPEEGYRINSNIYSYIRHPMYTGDFFLALGLALFKNNLYAIFIALLSFIPYIVALKLEDNELIKRFGEPHRQYVRQTHAIFPHFKDIGKFLKLLFTKEKNVNK